MFVEHAYGATVVAQGWVDCLKLERSVLHAQMREDPDLAARLAQVVRDRLKRLATELREVDDLLASISRRLASPPRPLLAPPVQTAQLEQGQPLQG
jgi:hypothetical protein